MPIVVLVIFCDPITEWILAKTEELKERTKKLRKENKNENKQN